ncbi:hypothetical protein [Facilibium subflavum]|uniref:hypothetical protein n=1 Tax=Facilibium subflavum TaxID=2219058 RepID=UPI000E6487BF|nr:hypothetical protein [Facilibium subflavum]
MWDQIDSSSIFFLRSTLFGISKSLYGRKVNNLVASSEFDAFHLSYSGAYLTQFDRECTIVFKKMALKYSVEQNVFEFSLSDFFREMRRKNYGKNDRDMVFKSLIKNYNTVYCIDFNGKSFEGKSLKFFDYDNDRRKFIAKLDEKWIDFFNETPNYQYNYAQRQSLPRGFCRWLHSYWSTFDHIPVMNIQELLYRSKTGYKDKGNFKKIVLSALSKMIQIGFLDQRSHITYHGDIYAIKKNQSI